jgi:hypothetical protein
VPFFDFLLHIHLLLFEDGDELDGTKDVRKEHHRLNDGRDKGVDDASTFLNLLESHVVLIFVQLIQAVLFFVEYDVLDVLKQLHDHRAEDVDKGGDGRRHR